MGLITYLTTVRFELGAARELEGDLAALGIDRPLIVTDAGVKATGLLERLTERSSTLQRAPVFDEVSTNPTEESVEAALAAYRHNTCDGIVAVGGGSPIDLAKAIALLATHEAPLEAYAAILGGMQRISARVAPVIAVPTTAGTGSEVGRAALITLRDGRKLGFISQYLIPKLAVCDPELTVGLPPALTAATGMDAITHCVETFLSPRDNPPAEAIALDGLSRGVRFLERAVRRGDDIEARREMMMAALEGGLTFQKGLGAVHSLSHALGGYKDLKLHHGTLNAVLLPAVLRFNEPSAEAKFRGLRSAMGLADGQDLAVFIEDLNARLGLPKSLSDMGVPGEILGAVAAAAVVDHSTATNPRPVSEHDFAQILSNAF
jgi:hypothetical protein